MKKFLLYVFIFVCLLIPGRIGAATISGSSITGASQINVGEELSVTFKINFSGIESGYEKRLGIWLVSFDLIYDDSVFIISGITSPNFDSVIYEDSDSYFVLSDVIESNSASNYCAYGTLYCGNYTATIKFFVKDTNVTSSTIKMTNIEVGLLDMVDNYKEYTEDDLIVLNSAANKNYTVTINKAQSQVVSIPKDITSNNKPKSAEKKTSGENTVTNVDTSSTIKKSDNAFLSSLEIDGYEIKFDKNTNDYTIYIDSDVNSLNIKTTLEDDKASYKIIGADDLKSNDYKVTIEVTSENNTKNTYTINTKINEEKSGVVKNNKSDNNDDKSDSDTGKKLIVYTVIGLVIAIVIAIIVAIVRKIKDRKIDKLFDQL